MNKFLRVLTKNVHVWAGLSFGLLFCMMGLTGSLLIYRAEIEKALRPDWHAVSAARPASPLLEAERNVKSRWPDSTLTQVALASDPKEPLRLAIRNAGKRMSVYCDAVTGEVLGTFEVAWMESVVSLHHNLLIKGVGRQLVGVIGIMMFLASLSGLAIWLWRGMLRNGMWKTIFRVDWRRPKTFNFQSHRLLGLAANVFLLVLSITGIALGFPQTFGGAVEAAAGQPMGKMARIKVEKSDARLPLDVYIRAALHEIPGGQVRELRLPQSATSPVTARVWHEGDFRPEGSNQVTLNPATAAVLAVDRSSSWSTAKRVAMAPAPIHYAEWGGGIVKALWCAAGITPTLLFLSGFAIWWVTYSGTRKVRLAARAARAEEAEGMLAAS